MSKKTLHYTDDDSFSDEETEDGETMINTPESGDSDSSQFSQRAYRVNRKSMGRPSLSTYTQHSPDSNRSANRSRVSHKPIEKKSLRTPPEDHHRVRSDADRFEHHHKGSVKVERTSRTEQGRGFSFGNESMSTIPLPPEEEHGPGDIKDIYQEMQFINEKMKMEFKVLHERGALLKDKERILEQRDLSLSEDKRQFSKLVDDEVNRRMALREQEHKTEIEKMKFTMKERMNEYKRLKENFDTLKTANDTLRKELETLQKQHTKLEKTSAGLQARLTNFHRRQDLGSKKEANFLPLELIKKKTETKEVKVKQQPKLTLGTYEVLGVLLEWISEVHLRCTLTDQPTKPLEGTNAAQFVQEKCVKVLPSLVELLRDLPISNQSLVLPCLQFVFWSLIHMDTVAHYQRSAMTSTLRRLGGELYKPRTVKFSDEDPAAVPPGVSHSTAVPSGVSHSKPDKVNKEGLFFKSGNLHVRLLSSLIILKTLNQVDQVAHVFEVLKADLKSENAKELFLYYQATGVLIPYLRPANKALTNSAIDIYLQLSMESPLLPSFLETCSSEVWFRSISMVLRMPNVEEKIIEKLSIILQKLSKNRGNKKYFEVFGITTTAQEMLRSICTDNAFLALNLKSILFNLNVKSGTLSSSNNTSILSSATACQNYIASSDPSLDFKI